MTNLRTELPDAPARSTIADDLGRNLFVEAGAGSGKTTALVQRIVRLVGSGVPVSRIAAITFTEAAARELRSRVRDELERRGSDGNDLQLVKAAGEVESAAFTTLHGFALRLLSDHPVEAGLPPGFAVADEIGSMLEFDEAWRVFAGQVGDDLDLLEFQERAAVLGVELRRFRDIARRFDDNWDLLSTVDRDPAALSKLELETSLDRVVQLGHLTEHCLDPEDRLAAALLEFSAEAEGCASLDELAQLEWLDGARWPGGRLGRKDNWAGITVDEARERVKAEQAAIAEIIARYRIEVIDHYVAWVANFVDERVQHRQSSGELAFHDLLVLARRLLRDHETVRETLHQRYSRVLLDEFQDTDPIQIELAVLLAADGLVADRRWQDLALDLQPGRLAVVGDPKQSIYRFRRADTHVYADAESALVDNVFHLTANFRSVPGVVDWVNAFFEEAIGKGEAGAQPSYTPLAPIRSAQPEAEVPVVVLGGPHERKTSVGEIRELEAADVAAVICRAVEEEWMVQRPTEDGDQWLPVRLQDIAVLIPSRLSLPALESAFGTANLPFRPETSSLVYATQEVRDVLAGVRAVVDPANSVDVVAALRSGLFAIGDEDLLAWHLADGTWDYTVALRDRSDAQPGIPDDDAPEDAGDAIAQAFRVLASWHRDRRWTEPAALIDRIVTEQRLREAALAENRPRDRWRRYRFLAEQARQFTATRDGDLHDFIDWVEVQSSDMARVTEPIAAEPDDDAVRVLTVHGSKGLEFPMVILAGAPTQETNRSSGPQVLFPHGAPPEVKLAKGKTTAMFDVHASVEEVLDRYERVRLQYVAATRARDLLVVSAHHKEGLQSSGRRIWEGRESCDGLWRSFERRGDERHLVEPPTQLRLTAGTYVENARIWDEEQEHLLARTSRFQTFSATGIASGIRSQELAGARAVGAAADGDAFALREREEPDPEVEPWRRGRAGSAIGSAVHATLQVIDFADQRDLEALARFNASREGIEELADDVAKLVRSALAAPSITEAASAKHWRELYVAIPVDNALIEGFIDLVLERDDGLVVIDYKTDHIASEADIASKLMQYQYQAATYAVALEHLTKRSVSACRFLFVGPDLTIERDVSDLDAAKAAVLTHVGDSSPGR